MYSFKRIAGSLVRQTHPRQHFESAANFRTLIDSQVNMLPVKHGIFEEWINKFPVMSVRKASTLALSEEEKQQQGEEKGMMGTGSAGGKGDGPEKSAVHSYWGVSPAKLFKEDGTEWKWKSFRVRCLLDFLFVNLFFFFFGCCW